MLNNEAFAINLRNLLSQDKKNFGFFIAAGCPYAIKKTDGQPLIENIAGLTQLINTALKDSQQYKNLLTKLTLKNKEINNEKESEINIENILSFIRELQQIATNQEELYDCKLSDLQAIEEEICQKIQQTLSVEKELPKDSPYHKFAKWIAAINREYPVEIFTLNYDLLIESVFDAMRIPYFDGFVGSYKPFLDLKAIEDDNNKIISQHWTRLWKIHGSINWFQDNDNNIYRAINTQQNDTKSLIYPSNLKYDQSRKMPYLAFMDRLSKFLKQSNVYLIISGYSFNDEHINDTIMNSLNINSSATVFALLFDELDKYPKAKNLAHKHANIVLLAKDKVVIGTITQKHNDEQLNNQEIKINELGDFIQLGKFLETVVHDNAERLHKYYEKEC